MRNEIGDPEGNCPVQAYGFIDDHPFYFRSRGSHWTFDVVAPGEDPVSSKCIYGRFGYVGEWPAAGWLPVDEAKRIIAECVAQFRSGVRGTVWCECPEDQKRKAMTDEDRFAYDMAQASARLFAPNPFLKRIKDAEE